MSANYCPTRSELMSYVHGIMRPPQAGFVTEHLASCSTCETAMDELTVAADGLIDRIRFPAQPQPYVDEPACHKVVESVQRRTLTGNDPTDCEFASSKSARIMNRTEFIEFVTTVGFVSATEMAALEKQLPSSEATDAQDLARVLVQNGKLTKFQAGVVVDGMGKSLLFGEHVVLDQIGAGGMGRVYKAKHRRMDRIVALKVISPTAMKDADAVKRFEREVRAAAKLVHPNIVHAYDASQQDGVHYLVMEYVDGPDLLSLVKKLGTLTVKQAVDFIAQAARGFAFAHANGVIHRDVKPGNLLVNRSGTVKILDMGLARFDDVGVGDVLTESELTQSGAVMGTFDYMAPEQARNVRQADAKSDVYGLGCTFYRLLTGESAYGGQTMIEKIFAHREDPVPSLRRFLPDAPPELEALMAEMLAKDSRARPSMQEVADRLAMLMTVLMPQTKPAEVARTPVAAAANSASPTTPRGPVPPSGNRRQLLTAAAGAGAVLIALGIWIYVKNERGETIAEVKVNEGASVEVKPLPPVGAPEVGKLGSAAGSRSPLAAPTAKATASGSARPAAGRATKVLDISDPERRAAIWAKPLGAKISVQVGGKSIAVYNSPLPEEPFVVKQIDFFEVLNNNEARRNIADADVANLAGLRDIVKLRLPYTQLTDAGMTSLGTLTSLEILDLNEAKITDAGIAKLATLANVKQLNLNQAAVTDVGLERIAQQFPKLQDGLQLDGARITDAGLAKLVGLKHLRFLTLNRTSIGDAGLVHLEALQSLGRVELNGTRVTAAGVARLRAAKPTLRIDWDPTIPPPTDASSNSAAAPAASS